MSNVPGVVLLICGKVNPLISLTSAGIGPTIPYVLCSLNCAVERSPMFKSFDQALLFTARYILLLTVSVEIMYPLLTKLEPLFNTSLLPTVNVNDWLIVNS